MGLSHAKCLDGIFRMRSEVYQESGPQRYTVRQWRRRGVWVWSMVLIVLLLQSGVSGCGRKGPPKPLHQQAPSERTP